MPGFIHGLNCHQLQDVITEAHRELKDPTIVAYDGKQHDSNQHACLIKLVDVFFFKLVLKKLFPALMIPDTLYDKVESILCSIELPYYMRTK